MGTELLTTCSVVLIHGLNGHPHDTWTTKKPEVFWPEQLLPHNLKKEQARVLVYGYDADVTSFMGGTSKDKIHNHAENLVAKLYANRSVCPHFMLESEQGC